MEQLNFSSGPPTEKSILEIKLAEIFKKIEDKSVFEQLLKELFLQKD